MKKFLLPIVFATMVVSSAHAQGVRLTGVPDGWHVENIGHPERGERCRAPARKLVITSECKRITSSDGRVGKRCKLDCVAASDPRPRAR